LTFVHMFFFFVALFALCSSEQNVIESQEQSGGCSICQLVVSYVDSYLQQNMTQNEIIAKVDELCTKIPLFGQECEQLASYEIPRIIQELTNATSPDAICQKIGVCASPKPKDIGPIPCSLCQIVVTYVEKWVTENATERAISERLDIFCSALGPLAPECDSFNAIYVPKLINWIVQKQPPQIFCSEVHLCQSARFTVIKEKLEHKMRLNRMHSHIKRADDEVQQSGGCQICQVVVTYVEQLVAQNQTVSKIVQKVEELCSFTPPPLNQVCDTIASKYVPSLVAWILRKENPQAFCAQVKLC